MKYQLILQWPATSINDYDKMIDIENTLTANLADQSEVDGHDVGSGEVNEIAGTTRKDGGKSTGGCKAAATGNYR